jgi:hypothetical protein
MPDVIELAAPAGVDPPLWLQNAQYPALIDRDLIDAIWSSAGIVLAGDLVVGPRGTGANMSVDVAAGRAVVVGSDAAGQGKYLCRASSTVNLPVAVAPGPGTSRIDLVVAHVYDDAVIGGTQHFWQPEIVAGTAAAAPVAPPQPPSSLLLATLTIPSGLAAVAAGNIVDGRALVAYPLQTRPVIPRGIVVYGNAVANPASPSVLPLATVLLGPTAWLAGNTVTVPAGAGGLYLVELAVNYLSSTTAAVGFSVRNSAGADFAPIFNVAGLIAVGNPRATVHGSWLAQVPDGQTFRVYCSANPIAAGDARVDRFSLVRLGDALPAAGATLLPAPPPPEATELPAPAPPAQPKEET